MVLKLISLPLTTNVDYLKNTIEINLENDTANDEDELVLGIDHCTRMNLLDMLIKNRNYAIIGANSNVIEAKMKLKEENNKLINLLLTWSVRSMAKIENEISKNNEGDFKI